MSHYDRRPLREWEQPKRRRNPSQQIGMLRLVGFVAILAGSYLVVNPARDRTPATTPTATTPRVAVDRALAPTVRSRLPHATITTGSSAELADKIRGGLTVDLAILERTPTLRLATAERCSDPQPIAQRAAAQYAACFVNAAGSSRQLAATARNALTDLAARSALLDAGFDIPEARPTPLATTTAPPPRAAPTPTIP